MDYLPSPAAYLQHTLDISRGQSFRLLALIVFTLSVAGAWLFYLALYLVAPVPRAPLLSEKKYVHIDSKGQLQESEDLPCWQDKWTAYKKRKGQEGDPIETGIGIEKAEVFMSLVVPAYNEEERLAIMLSEATDYLQQEYGDSQPLKDANGSAKKRTNGHALGDMSTSKGWEVLVVSDGSTDETIETALQCARDIGGKAAANVRVIHLEKNRGKGGAVVHGMRHVRGQYAMFADADGASKFEDLGKLVRECRRNEDKEGRGVAVGSRAHLVGSEAVVKRSFLRNLLMHSFHLLLRLLTPPATAAIRDTQCGFKLFSRSSLPYIIPYMHSEGWIFDVEMLMLAESANIPVVEVPVGWKEVKGSKLNVLWDSLGMAWGLAILRAAWGLNIYKRD